MTYCMILFVFYLLEVYICPTLKGRVLHKGVNAGRQGSLGAILETTYCSQGKQNMVINAYLLIKVNY